MSSASCRPSQMSLGLKKRSAALILRRRIANDGTEIVDEVRLIVIAEFECKLGVVGLCAGVDPLKKLVQAVAANDPFWRNADILVEEPLKGSLSQTGPAERSSTVRMSGSDKMRLTSSAASVAASSTRGACAEKKRLAAAIETSSFSDVVRTVSRVSTSLPKISRIGTIRSARDDTGAFKNARKPPSVNLMPKACERPSS